MPAHGTRSKGGATAVNAADGGRSVLGRGLAVLAPFSREQPELTVTAIQHATGLPSATAHRLAAELAEWGARERVGRAVTGSGSGCGSSARSRPRRATCGTWHCRSCRTCSR